MLFPTPIFMFVFAPIAIVGFWLIKNGKLRRLWLVVASYIFYGYWKWSFMSLMFICTGVNYLAGRMISSTESISIKRMWLVFTLVISLGLLFYYKYFMLILHTINGIGGLFGNPDVVGVWEIILPIGISFFTFVALSYSIDVYRGKVKATTDFIEFAAFVSLFPHLIAGPVIRYSEISDRLRNLPKRITEDELNFGFLCFTTGLIKKVLIADRLAYFINPMFTDYANLRPLEAWLAMLGYSLQLYFDFAGYSLMAIGLAYLLGFEFPQNFNSPYKATSISDFWRRWHMTLSRWLKDYLYIPLGGRNNRAIALAATMLLGGLWHGAEWTFVAWGAYHAILLELHHHLKQVPWLPKNKVWAQIGTFLLVTIGWVFFRPPTFHASWTILTKMFNIPGLFQASPVNFGLVFFIVVAGSIAMLAPNVVELIRVKKAPLERKWAIIIGILTAACILFLSEPTPFLYYQF
ncbi:MAG: hypothetical protein NTY09_04675 [bacterium]|nr:hypothetical protein [bacterium]